MTTFSSDLWRRASLAADPSPPPIMNIVVGLKTRIRSRVRLLLKLQKVVTFFTQVRHAYYKIETIVQNYFFWYMHAQHDQVARF